ncbi:MAG: histidine phosphatase family protein [Desulfobacterales bacterium]|nr:histidine phosphatase family protein [Desulfobacterales bacterium]
MILYYVRHGQSANNALLDATGAETDRVVDPELTPAGLKQAVCVAQMLCGGQHLTRSRASSKTGFGVTHLYCSLMTRAVHTAQFISQSLDLPLAGRTDIHEGGGIFLEDRVTGELTGFPGGTRTELCTRFPELVWPADAREDGWWNRPFEAIPDRKLRARRVLAELLARHGGTDDRVVFVSHGGFFYRFMCAVLDLPDPEGLWFHMYNTAVSCLEFTADGGVGVRYLNRTDHLPPDLIT